MEVDVQEEDEQGWKIKKCQCKPNWFTCEVHKTLLNLDNYELQMRVINLLKMHSAGWYTKQFLPNSTNMILYFYLKHTPTR